MSGPTTSTADTSSFDRRKLAQLDLQPDLGVAAVSEQRELTLAAAVRDQLIQDGVRGGGSLVGLALYVELVAASREWRAVGSLKDEVDPRLTRRGRLGRRAILRRLQRGARPGDDGDLQLAGAGRVHPEPERLELPLASGRRAPVHDPPRSGRVRNADTDTLHTRSTPMCIVKLRSTRPKDRRRVLLVQSRPS